MWLLLIGLLTPFPKCSHFVHLNKKKHFTNETLDPNPELCLKRAGAIYWKGNCMSPLCWKYLCESGETVYFQCNEREEIRWSGFSVSILILHTCFICASCSKLLTYLATTGSYEIPTKMVEKLSHCQFQNSLSKTFLLKAEVKSCLLLLMQSPQKFPLSFSK